MLEQFPYFFQTEYPLALFGLDLHSIFWCNLDSHVFHLLHEVFRTFQLYLCNVIIWPYWMIRCYMTILYLHTYCSSNTIRWIWGASFSAPTFSIISLTNKTFYWSFTLGQNYYQEKYWNWWLEYVIILTDCHGLNFVAK